MNQVPAPPESMGLLFRQVRDAMWAEMAREMASAGHELTYSQFMTIQYLAVDSNAGATDLARHAQVNPGNMTRLLDKLEARGLLQRIAVPNDRRALNIVLTEAGQAIWSDIQHCGERVRARAMQGMDDHERQQMFHLLNQVLQNLTPPIANDD
ncbi:MAG: MarR family transcriptional regulator [Pseudoxanthomonas sp.]